MQTIVLVSCVSKKADIPMPAKDLYQSTWFRYARQYAELVGDRWFILSAKYGLAEPEEVLYPYDLSMNDLPHWERKEWACDLFAAIERTTGFRHRFVILAGKSYREYLVKSLRLSGAVVEVPMAGLGIGQQVAWLKEQVKTLENARRERR